ncbi:MAG: hypothetical protein HWE24_10575 [Oceanospirillaceae bacterium]|nr:hypothetical protein [Oceanospirillaceae bacterium]
MYYIKVLLTIFTFAIVITIIGTAVDWFLALFDIPIVAMDVLSTSFFLFVIYVFPKLKLEKYIDNHVMYFSPFRFIGFIMFTVVFCVIGGVCAFLGLIDPLHLTQGRGGSGLHGYSMAILGIAIFLLSAKLLYFAIIKRWKLKHNKID